MSVKPDLDQLRDEIRARRGAEERLVAIGLAPNIAQSLADTTPRKDMTTTLMGVPYFTNPGYPDNYVVFLGPAGRVLGWVVLGEGK
jgi:hypothetical protein